MTRIINANGGLPLRPLDWTPNRWEDDIDTVVSALYACHMTLENTAPALLRGWERMEDRRCGG